MDNSHADYKEGRAISTRAKDILLAPLRLALSPTLLRTYLRTFLILLTSTTLFAIAIVAYTSFYVAYIPVQGISVPVYLHFDTSTPAHGNDGAAGRRFPYGVADVKGLVARQKYDVGVEIELPRSDRNLAAGNWMVGVEVRGPGSTVGEEVRKGLLEWEGEEDFSRGKQRARMPVPGVGRPAVLARSRRPALLTYRSWVTEHAYRTLRLPLYVLGWGQESETLSVLLLESVEFERGWRSIPTSLRLEVRSATPLEIYRVKVLFVARLEGLRWVMYTHRLASFVVFTSLFWGVEMGVVLLTWGYFTLLFGAGRANEEEAASREKSFIKSEPDMMGATTPKTEPSSAPSTPRSDTSRTFPTLSNQQSLHYSSGEAGKIKREQDREEKLSLEDVPLRTEAEADDEDDD
ncbi:hypothetical protein K505DRAFT_287965, partial [Melanomma pulvis-pyrius CBS 109.77]